MSDRPSAAASAAPARGAGASGGFLRHPLAEPARAAAALALAGLPGFAPEGRPLRVVLLGLDAPETPALIAAFGAEVEALEPDGAVAEAAAALLRAADLPGRIRHAPPGDWPRLLAEGPEADYAAMPEGWSELPLPLRDALAAALGARLRIGGVFHLAHAVLPGALDEAPFRQLCRAAWAETDPAATTETRARAALARVEALLPAFHLTMRAHPRYPALLQELRETPPARAAARWFAAEHVPETMGALGARLAAAGFGGLSPADPARLAEDLDFTEEQLRIFAAPPAFADPARAAFHGAELRDLAARRSVRTDLMLRGPAARPDPARAGALLLRRAAPVGQALSRPLVGFLGPHAPARAVYGPLLEAFSEAAPATLSAAAAAAGMNAAQAAPLAAALLGQGALAPALDEAAAAAVAPACARVNAAILRGGAGGWRAAPGLGCALLAPEGAADFPAAQSDSGGRDALFAPPDGGEAAEFRARWLRALGL